MNFVSRSQAAKMNPRQRRYFGRGPIHLTKKGKRLRHSGQLKEIQEKINATCAPKCFSHIPGFCGRYSISRKGEVFGHFCGHLMSTVVNRGGYTTVTLSNGNRGKRPWEIHRLLLLTFKEGFPRSLECDHINRIKSDNRLCNLRFATRSLNGHNAIKPKLKKSTKYRGVSIINHGPRHWVAKIRGGKHCRQSRYFKTDIEAARAYDQMAIEEFGESAITNKYLGFL